jgi:hypothetical protein
MFFFFEVEEDNSGKSSKFFRVGLEDRLFIIPNHSFLFVEVFLLVICL